MSSPCERGDTTLALTNSKQVRELPALLGQWNYPLVSSYSVACLLGVQLEGCLSGYLFCRLDPHKHSEAETSYFLQVSTRFAGRNSLIWRVFLSQGTQSFYTGQEACLTLVPDRDTISISQGCLLCELLCKDHPKQMESVSLLWRQAGIDRHTEKSPNNGLILICLDWL